MPSVQRQETRIKVLACRHVYTGRNQLNHQYSIYEIDAARPDGQLINQKLRAFTALPIGQEIDVVVEPFNSDRYGKSFTLHPKEQPSSGGTQRMNELADKVVKLEERVAKLEAATEQSAPADGPPPPIGAHEW